MYWYVWIITKTVTPSISGITVLEILIEIVVIYKGRLFSLIKKSRIFNINTPFSILNSVISLHFLVVSHYFSLQRYNFILKYANIMPEKVYFSSFLVIPLCQRSFFCRGATFFCEQRSSQSIFIGF